MHQSCGSTLSNWKINTRRFEFNAKDIDYVFVNHCHIDHIGLLPLLYKRGSNAEIFAPVKTKQIADILMKDSAHIIQSDSEELTRKLGRQYLPYFDVDDVEKVLNDWNEVVTDEIITIDEFIKFRFVSSGHIVGACQLELWITDEGATKKILYTSDLGNIHIDKAYIKPFVRVDKANIVIGESTYAHEKRIADEKMREKDIEKLKSAIQQTCIDLHSRVLIPSFALDRTQNIMSVLYDIYHNDTSFDIPIYIDSPMSTKVCEVYKDILDEEDRKKWLDVLHWKNIHFVGDYIESRSLRESKSPCIVIASSGFLVAGRSVAWLASILPNANDRVITVGYAPYGSIAYTIKNEQQKTISITGKRYHNKCQITNLCSFSSHMQRDSLLYYYSNIDCEKIYLVHGDMNGKIEFAKELQKAISKNNKTSRVICTNKDTVANL